MPRDLLRKNQRILQKPWQLPSAQTVSSKLLLLLLTLLQHQHHGLFPDLTMFTILMLLLISTAVPVTADAVIHAYNIIIIIIKIIIEQIDMLSIIKQCIGFD